MSANGQNGSSLPFPFMLPDTQQHEQDLASKALRIQNKRFYLDVRQNRRGRFIKLSESGTKRRSRIVMSFPVALEMTEKISKLSELYSQLQPHQQCSLAEDGRLASDTIVRDNRRYYLDLRENERGRFLRLAMLSMGVREQVVIPAQGMIELRNALLELTQMFPEEENDGFNDLPESKVLTVGNKVFYFDVGSNRFGVFLRISEVRASVRSSVTIPVQHCAKFRDIISELSEKIQAQGITNGSPVNGDGDDVKKGAKDEKKTMDVSKKGEAVVVS